MRLRSLFSFVFGSVSALTGCHATHNSAQSNVALATTSPPPVRTPVVVALVIDQFAGWVAAERLPQLPPTGGFARLLREGTYVRDARYAHAATDTAPGHAALFTGAPPRATGIFGNETVDPATGRATAIVRDESTRLIDPTGITKNAGASLAALRTETLADRLRGAYSNAVILSFSLKDRGTLFAAGHRPNAAIWYDPGLDAMVTSSAYGSELPAWSLSLGNHEQLLRNRSVPWQPLDPTWVQQHARTPDQQDGENDLMGYGTTFPHRVGDSKSQPAAFRASPFGDEVLLGLALAGLGASPDAGRVPTLVTISLSSNDLIGHTFGPDSWEAWDELRRLDRALGQFFSALDSRFGADGYFVVLSGDHGVVPLPETAGQPAARPWCTARTADPWQRPCDPSPRILGDRLLADLETAAEGLLGKGKWVAGVSDPYVYLAADAKALAPTKRASLMDELTKVIQKYPGMATVVRTADLPANCPGPENETVEALVCRAYVPGRGGELYLIPKIGSFFDPSSVGRGTSHGSPYLYDRSVPLLMRAPGRIAAGVVIAEPARTASYVRTAASLLGISPPQVALPARDFAAPASSTAAADSVKPRP